jgi:sugar phosphate isomerase/epimerase
LLSLSPLTVLPCSPLEQIDAAHAAGFDAVGLRLLPVMDSDMEVLSDAGLRRLISQRLASTGLQVLDVEVARVGPDTDVSSLAAVLEYAGDLGARHLALTSVGLEEYDPAREDRVVAKLRDLCEMAERHRIKPMLEFMVYRGIGTIHDAARVVRSVGHPGLGICVDALHLARSGGSPADVAAMDPGLIHCAQLCDAPAVAPPPEALPIEARSGRMFPGEGQLPLRALLDALPRGVPISVEVPSAMSGISAAGRAAQAARSVRALLRSAGRSPP